MPIKKIKILFVCLGNICRSPLAQGIFQNKIEKQNIQNFFSIDSAGTSNEHAGEPPYSFSIKEAHRHSIDITQQISRGLTINDKDNFDYFIAMDKWNYENMINDFQVSAKRTYKMRSFDTIDKNGDIPDPWSQNQSAFQNVFNMLDRCIEQFIVFLRKTHQI